MTDKALEKALKSWVHGQIDKGNSNLYPQLEALVQQTLLNELSKRIQIVYGRAAVIGISRPRMIRWENKNYGE